MVLVDGMVLALPGALVLLGLAGLVWRGRRWTLCYRRAAEGTSALVALAALAVGVLVWRDGPVDRLFTGSVAGIPVPLGIHVDALSALMLALTATLGFVVCRYSVRYLDGAAGQARFLAWTLLTLAAVLCLLCARNLVAFLLCWCAVSAGLHQLLTFFPERPAALRAAWHKFAISRVGDACLLGAAALTWRAYGTLEIPELFHLASSGAGGPEASGVALLLVLGAMTKSAQFPFHTWLPETMDTPTPVSALMHAGIINSGGFLIIRLSPLVAQSPLAMDVLMVNGALTAALGSVVMLAQTDVKRALAYSTVAQMGFMMMQSGLGAFSAAALHIVAHGLYKAHAFLAAGGSASWSPKPAEVAPVRAFLLGAAALVIAATLVATAVAAAGVDLLGKPGGLVIATFLTAAVSPFAFRALGEQDLSIPQRGVVASLGLLLVLAYLAAWRAVDAALAPFLGFSQLLGEPSAFDRAFALVVAGSILAALFTGWAGRRLAAGTAGRRLYVLALNGFHVADLVRAPFGTRRPAVSLSCRRVDVANRN